jgi:capsule biosynthesis phosphatase
MTEAVSSVVIDLDGTICEHKRAGQGYDDVAPKREVIAQLWAYRAQGYRIVVHTARSMRTYAGALGMINAHTARGVLDYLDRHDVPYDEVLFGKPWPGPRGFYVDDRAIRPDEFAALSPEQIAERLGDA